MRDNVRSRLIHLIIGLVLLIAFPCLGKAQEDGNSSPDSPPQPTGIKVTSFEELVNVFKTRNIAIESNSKNQVIQINASQDDSRSVLVIKWDNKNGVIHYIQVMPLILKEEQEALFLQSAAILNHGFLFPGIGINPVNHGTYYRLSLPISPRGYLWDFEVITLTRFTMNKAAEFLPTLTAILDGKIEVKDTLTAHQQHLKALAKSRIVSNIFTRKYSTQALGSEWILDFKKETVQLLRDGKLAIQSNYSVNNNQLTFTDTAGPLASKDAATYQYRLDQDRLIFDVVNDTSSGRTKVITGDLWTLTK